jgi:hypothetical protein
VKDTCCKPRRTEDNWLPRSKNEIVHVLSCIFFRKVARPFRTLEAVNELKVWVGGWIIEGPYDYDPLNVIQVCSAKCGNLGFDLAQGVLGDIKEKAASGPVVAQPVRVDCLCFGTDLAAGSDEGIGRVYGVEEVDFLAGAAGSDYGIAR